MISVFNQKSCKLIYIKLIFRNHTSVRSTCECRQHRCKSGISPEYFKNQKSLVRSGRCSEAVCHLNGSRYAGAEANAIISSGHIIIHCFGNGNNVYPFFVKVNTITECIITAYWYKVINTKPFKIFYDFRCKVVHFSIIGTLQMFRNIGFCHMAWPCSGSMQESSPGSSCLINNIVSKDLKIVAVIRLSISDQFGNSCPSPAKSDYFVSFPVCTDGHSTNCRIKSWDISPSGTNSTDPLSCFISCHVLLLFIWFHY